MTADYKTLDQFPNLRIYADGNIYNERVGRCHKLRANKDGYMCTKVFNADGIRKTIPTHRLIAMAWIPNPDNLSDVDHIDHDRTNNNLENLRWVSKSTNQRNQSLSAANTSGFQGVRCCRDRPKKWRAFWCNEEGIEMSKAFKHKGDAIEYREQMVKKYYKRPNMKRQEANLCPTQKLFKTYTLIELMFKYHHA